MTKDGRPWYDERREPDRARYCRSIMREISWRGGPGGRDGSVGEEAFAADSPKGLAPPKAWTCKVPRCPGPND